MKSTMVYTCSKPKERRQRFAKAFALISDQTADKNYGERKAEVLQSLAEEVDSSLDFAFDDLDAQLDA